MTGCRCNSPQSLSWTIGRRTVDLAVRPCIMGILNVTPDSFSDGNRFFSPDKAVERALAMEADGADIIDIGGESTRPDAPPVSTEEELRRVVPVVERLAGRLRVPLSIDTTKAVVAEAALSAGAEIVNDISAMTFDSRMPEVVAATGAGIVLQHTRGTPVEMQKDTRYGDLVGDIKMFLEEAMLKADRAGIPPERIVVDPGIGFGKDWGGNLEILRRLDEFSSLGRPILVGTSRKAFIGKVLERSVDERVFGTAATVALALAAGASIFRVHDVREMRDVADMSRAILQGTR
nr:dihydropteroate synthase [Geomobilimonas luticola]